MAASLEARRLAIAAALRAVMAEPLRSPSPRGPSLREALTAEIDWDEPSHLDALDDDLDRSPDNLAGIEAYDDDWISPSVPPLEVAGSMSRVASEALFGHA